MDRNRSSMGFNKPITNEKIFDFNRTPNTPYQMDQREISSKRMKVVICLSNTECIDNVRQALPDMEVKGNGNEITVSGLPPGGEDSVLAIVQKYDRYAALK